MSRIKVMDQALANLIAAGEVIERPASVVKELVENSIDAGASSVTVEIERAGARLIAVSDNGCGMDEEDARLALELHGTSKLSEPSGIAHIATLGFRGEALPSIAQVSKLTLTARSAASPAGIELHVEGGKIVSEQPSGCRVGCAVRVEDLFFNTPARKKFLKSPGTEELHIEEALTMLALCCCGVGFSLKIDGRMAFNLPPGTLNSRLRELFGKEYCSNLIELRAKEGNMSVSGYIGVPGFTRSSRREQRIFVNRRPVDSAAVLKGLREGYATLNEPGRFPPALLFVELPPEEIDVNVHPAKREIRFRSEFGVIRAVSSAVSNALRNWGAGGGQEDEEELPEAAPDSLPVPEKTERFAVPPPEKQALPISGKIPLKYVMDGAAVSYTPKKEDTPDLHFEGPRAEHHLTDRNPEAEKTEAAEEEETIPPAASAGFWPDRIIGIYDDTYILASGPDGLLLIDQHAAHERVMFERLLRAWHRKEIPAQGLLIPETLELPRVQLNFLLNHLEFFRDLGFDFSPAGGLTVLVNAIPAELKYKGSLSGLIADMLNMLLAENSRAPAERDLEAVARAACHAAVKAHDPLSESDALKLLEEMKQCRQGTLCPHGRPTMVTLTLREIEKRFGRR